MAVHSGPRQHPGALQWPHLAREAKEGWGDQDVELGCSPAALRGGPRHLQGVLLPFLSLHPLPRQTAASFPGGPLPPDTYFPLCSAELPALPSCSAPALFPAPSLPNTRLCPHLVPPIRNIPSLRTGPSSHVATVSHCSHEGLRLSGPAPSEMLPYSTEGEFLVTPGPLRTTLPAKI